MSVKLVHVDYPFYTFPFADTLFVVPFYLKNKVHFTLKTMHTSTQDAVYRGAPPQHTHMHSQALERFDI